VTDVEACAWLGKLETSARAKHDAVGDALATYCRETIDVLQRLRTLLAESVREHYHCEDSWFCCGKCTHGDHSDNATDYPHTHDGEAARVEGVCNCSADAWNAKVEQALGAQ
jgi:hypothetical protein